MKRTYSDYIYVGCKIGSMNARIGKEEMKGSIGEIGEKGRSPMIAQLNKNLEAGGEEKTKNFELLKN